MRKTRGGSVNQKVFLLIALLLVVVLGGLLWVFLRFILPSEVADTGIVMVYSDEEEIIPLSNRAFTFDRELVADWERLSPQDAFYSAPIISYGPDFTVRLSGQQVHFPKYEVYGEDLEKPIMYGESLAIPSQPGTYLVYLQVVWGNADKHTGVQYFFRLLVE